MDTTPSTSPPGADAVPTPVTDAARRLSQLSFGVAGLAFSAGKHLAERALNAHAESALATVPSLHEPDAPAATPLPGDPVPAVPIPGAPALIVPPPISPVSLVGGAILGAGFVAQARLLDASAAFEIRATRFSRRFLAPPDPAGPARRPSIMVRGLEPWFEIGNRYQAYNEAAAAATVSRLFPEMLDATITGLDLPALIARLPLDELLDEIDLNGIISRVDLDALLRKVDIGAIVMGSTGTVTTEAVDASRGLTVRADSLVARITDKVLLRKNGRHLDLDGFDLIAPPLGPKDKQAAIDVTSGPAPPETPSSGGSPR